MNKFLSLSLAATAAACLTGFSSSTLAQAQLSGTPDELREFLYPRPNTVNINGEGELTAYKDVAKISLMVTSEENVNRLTAVQQSGVSAICDKPFEPAVVRHLVHHIIDG